MKNRKRFIIAGCILGCVLCVIFSFFNKETQYIKEEYSQLVQQIERGEVSEIELDKVSSIAQITDKNRQKYFVEIPDVEDFSQYVREKIIQGSTFKFNTIVSKNSAWSMILSLLPNILFIVILIILYRKMGILGNNMQISPIHTDITFKDIAGLDEEIEQVKVVVEFLKRPEKFLNAGAKIPKGILFHGKPGTGKTLLAKAIAGESGVPFFAMSASNFEEKYVGVGASRIRSLFKKARECAPCIIFIDEIDSLIKNRYGAGNNGIEQTLNQFLSELDGVGEEANIVIIGATNHKEVLDEAAIRAGRFNEHIYIPTPNAQAREEILRVHARNKKIAKEVSLKELAEKAVGFTGADLANVLNKASILSVSSNNGEISQKNIDEAIAIILLGVAKKSDNTDEESKKVAAVHEAGHALMAKILHPDREVYEISIIRRGSAAGYTLSNHPEKLFYQKKELLSRIDELLGGRIAEELMLDDISSGAQNDLQRVSEIAYQMICYYGMGSLPLTLTGQSETFNENIEKEMITEIRQMIQQEITKVKRDLNKNKEALQKLSELLQERQKLNKKELEEFFKSIDI